jgi:hypothetical protein
MKVNPSRFSLVPILVLVLALLQAACSSKLTVEPMSTKKLTSTATIAETPAPTAMRTPVPKPTQTLVPSETATATLTIDMTHQIWYTPGRSQQSTWLAEWNKRETQKAEFPQIANISIPFHFRLMRNGLR